MINQYRTLVGEITWQRTVAALVGLVGPKFAAATKVPFARAFWNGDVHYWIAKLHGQYTSDVVRVSPDELSFITPSAWNDIYASRPGHERFPKDMALAPGLRSILNAGEEDHTRQRRILSYGFADKAIREQEYLIQNHVQNLVCGLKQEIEGCNHGKVNLVDWFNWTVFDIVGDLAFGEPFNCLQEPTFRPWVTMMVSSFRSVVRTVTVPCKFPPLPCILRALAATANLDKRGSQNRTKHQKSAIEKVERRLASGRTRPDIIGHILRHSESKGGMDKGEIHGNSSALIAAGGETTSTLICGAVWYASTNPAVLARVKEEVRQTFQNVEDIQLQNMDKLKYLNAVIQEAFRVYPPALSGQPRYVPQHGDTVSGHWIPGGTGVNVIQYAAYTSPRNFYLPLTFEPARWMGDPRFDGDKKEVLQPFSIGPRNCIGKNLANAEIRLIFSRMLWEFDWNISDKTDADWSNQKAWMTWSKKPLIVTLTKRT